jgi:formylglycine-generating enzyme required for sulfatase activity
MYKRKIFSHGLELQRSEEWWFEVVPYDEQETGPGLVLIEGGTFTMGRTEQEITQDWNNIPRRVTVSSFYIDETEVANVHYLEYLYGCHEYLRQIIRKSSKRHCPIHSYGATGSLTRTIG